MKQSDVLLKMKRKVRDFYNKNANDVLTILAVAKAMDYKEENIACSTQPNTDTPERIALTLQSKVVIP